MDPLSSVLPMESGLRPVRPSAYPCCPRKLISLHFVLWIASVGVVAVDGDGLEQVAEAFNTSLLQRAVLTRSSEIVQFYGVRADSRRMMQRDVTEVQGMYKFNPNARGLHDFHLNVTHRRRQELPRDEGKNLTLSEKSEYEIKFVDGELLMRMHQTSVPMFSRLPQGWFSVENFNLGNPITPDVSYLLVVDLRNVFRQSMLLDTALTQEDFVSDTKRIPRGGLTDIPGVKCYALQYRDLEFLLRTSLAISVKDFAGLPMTDDFTQEIGRNADVYFNVCLDPKTDLIVSYQSVRENTDVTARVRFWNATISWSAQKNTSFEYVDDLALPVLSTSASRSSSYMSPTLIVILFFLVS